MFIKGDLRRDKRTSYVATIRYFVSGLNSTETSKVNNCAVAVDVSSGGIGILTGYPLEKGHILTFIDEIKAINIKSKAAIVKWVGKFDSDKYRVGLEFV